MVSSLRFPLLLLSIARNAVFRIFWGFRRLSLALTRLVPAPAAPRLLPPFSGLWFPLCPL